MGSIPRVRARGFDSRWVRSRSVRVPGIPDPYRTPVRSPKPPLSQFPLPPSPRSTSPSASGSSNLPPLPPCPRRSTGSLLCPSHRPSGLALCSPPVPVRCSGPPPSTSSPSCRPPSGPLLSRPLLLVPAPTPCRCRGRSSLRSRCSRGSPCSPRCRQILSSGTRLVRLRSPATICTGKPHL